MSFNWHFRQGEPEAFRVREEDVLGQTASGYLCGAQPYLNKQSQPKNSQVMSQHTDHLTVSAANKIKTDWFKCGSHFI